MLFLLSKLCKRLKLNLIRNGQANSKQVCSCMFVVLNVKYLSLVLHQTCICSVIYPLPLLCSFSCDCVHMGVATLVQRLLCAVECRAVAGIPLGLYNEMQLRKKSAKLTGQVT